MVAQIRSFYCRVFVLSSTCATRSRLYHPRFTHARVLHAVYHAARFGLRTFPTHDASTTTPPTTTTTSFVTRYAVMGRFSGVGPHHTTTARTLDMTVLAVWMICYGPGQGRRTARRLSLSPVPRLLCMVVGMVGGGWWAVGRWAGGGCCCTPWRALPPLRMARMRRGMRARACGARARMARLARTLPASHFPGFYLPASLPMMGGSDK